jgi:primary-amine oxidase
MYQVFLYMRDPKKPTNPDSNHYAFPLPISPVIDSVTDEVIRIDTLPTGADAKLKHAPEPWKSKPANEYLPEYQNLRTDLKPLLVAQPQGASFTVTSAGETGSTIHWQKWTFRVGYNQREGPVLYDVS